MLHARPVLLAISLLAALPLILGCPTTGDDFDPSSDDDTGDDDTGDDDGADDDTADDDTADDDTGDDDTADDDTADDDTADDDTADDDTADDDTSPTTGTIEVTPPGVSFGPVYVGSNSLLGLQVQEIGNHPITITSTGLSGANADQFSATDLTGTVLPAGGSAQVSIQYQPTAAGAHYAQYLISTDGTPAVVIVNFSGIASWDPLDQDGDSDGFSPNQGDCDDTDPDIYPGAPERCNQLDDDCDGVIPANETTDVDGDGAPVCADCNDLDAALNLDDVDGDGWTTCGGDCDDLAANVNPSALEACDGIDNNCDGSLPASETTDNDGDNYLACEDCDDDNSAIHPGANDPPGDGIDWDCDGLD